MRLLIIAAVAVLALGVYLFHEVRTTPAQASASAPVLEAKPRPPLAPVVAKPTDVPTIPAAPATPAAPADAAEPPRANPNLDSLMDEANHAYDHGELDDAKAIALKVLGQAPGSVRMLRVMVSAWCQDSDQAEAQKYYAQLPVQDRAAMKTRCERSGVTFTDVPPPSR